MRGKPFDQLRERPRPAVGPQAMIGVDVLAEQRDLAHAVVDQAARLGFPRRRRDARTRRRACRAQRRSVQNLSQPSCTVRKALAARAGARLGSAANLSTSGNPVSTIGAAFRPCARDQIAQAVIALRAHNEIDAGARRAISAPSAWATQPATVMIVSLPAARRSSFTSRMRPRSE